MQQKNYGIFENKNVHFGSCSTMKMTHKDILTFKRLTKSRMATGYTKDVDFTSSFIFEIWLLDAIHTHKRHAAKPINEILQRKKHHTLQKYLVLNHSDFIYKQKEQRKNKEPTKLAFYLMLYRTSIVILGKKQIIVKFYIILDLKDLIEVYSVRYSPSSRNLQSRKITNYLKKELIMV